MNTIEQKLTELNETFAICSKKLRADPETHKHFSQLEKFQHWFKNVPTLRVPKVWIGGEKEYLHGEEARSYVLRHNLILNGFSLYLERLEGDRT